MSFSSKKYSLFFFALLIALPLFSQKKPSFEGKWKGTISQTEGYRTEYGMELYLTVKDGKVTGKSFVFVDDIYAEMILEGDMHRKSILLLKDVKIVDDAIMEGMEWCMKNYQLILKKDGSKWFLEGHWQGKTTFSTCVPGKVKLQRIVPRA